MSQLHRPGVAAEGTSYQNSNCRLGILIIAKWLLKKGEHRRVIGDEVAKPLDRGFTGHLAARPAVTVPQKRDLVKEGWKGLCTADARKVADLDWYVDIGFSLSCC